MSYMSAPRLLTGDQRFIVNGASLTKPASALAKPALYHDSKVLLPGTTGVDFFLSQAPNDRLDANYHKNPFLGADMTTRIEQLGFSFNADVVPISGANAAEAANNVSGFLNNLASATIEYGEGPGNCASGELRLLDFAAYRHEIVAVSTTQFLVKLYDTKLVALPEPVVIQPGRNFQLRVRFYASAALPAANAIPGVPGNTLKMIAQINATHYKQADAQTVAVSAGEPGMVLNVPSWP